jgi:hypothetical protein
MENFEANPIRWISVLEMRNHREVARKVSYTRYHEFSLRIILFDILHSSIFSQFTPSVLKYKHF